MLSACRPGEWDWCAARAGERGTVAKGISFGGELPASGKGVLGVALGGGVVGWCAFCEGVVGLLAFWVIGLFAFRGVGLFAFRVVGLFAFRVVGLFAFWGIGLFTFWVVRLFAFRVVGRFGVGVVWRFTAFVAFFRGVFSVTSSIRVLVASSVRIFVASGVWILVASSVWIFVASTPIGTSIRNVIASIGVAIPILSSLIALAGAIETSVSAGCVRIVSSDVQEALVAIRATLEEFLEGARIGRLQDLGIARGYVAASWKLGEGRVDGWR